MPKTLYPGRDALVLATRNAIATLPYYVLTQSQREAAEKFLSAVKTQDQSNALYQLLIQVTNQAQVIKHRDERIRGLEEALRVEREGRARDRQDAVTKIGVIAGQVDVLAERERERNTALREAFNILKTAMVPLARLIGVHYNG